MKVLKTELHIGVEKPFTILHMSDTHLTACDERDSHLAKWCVERSHQSMDEFLRAEENVAFAVRYQKACGYPLFHSGDMMDIVTQKNLEEVKSFVDETGCFACAGNHEFHQDIALYQGVGKEDKAYREQCLEEVQSVFVNNIRFSKKEIGGVNFVALDNGFKQIEPWQLRALKRVVAEGKPIVLLVHVPFYCAEMEKSYFAHLLDRYKQEIYLIPSFICYPDEKLMTYPEDMRAGLFADKYTREACEYIASEPLIKAVLAGHLHMDSEHLFAGKIPQIMTGVDTLREIVIK